MDYVTATLFGLVAGVTEFLPLSAEGHLVLLRELFPFELGEQLAFVAVMELAAALAALLYFKKVIFIMMQAIIRKLGRLPANEKDLTMAFTLLLASIPAVVLGFLLQDILFTEEVAVITLTLSLSAIFFIYAEWCYYQNPPQGTLTIKRGLIMGLLTIIALVPGFSRLGIALAGGMLLGLSRFEAARFTILLSIPILLSLGVTDLFKLFLHDDGMITWLPVLLLGLMTFLAALASIHYGLSFIRKNTLWPFVWYNLILATFVGYVAFFI